MLHVLYYFDPIKKYKNQDNVLNTLQFSPALKAFVRMQNINNKFNFIFFKNHLPV